MNASKMTLVAATWDKALGEPIAADCQAVYEAAIDALADMESEGLLNGMTTDQAEDAVRDFLLAQWRRYFVGWDHDTAKFAMRNVQFTIH